MAGWLECTKCHRHAPLAVDVLRLRCACGGSIAFVAGQPAPVSDSLTVPGTPALIDDLIRRFRVGDEVLIADASEGYCRLAEDALPGVRSCLEEIVAEHGGELCGLEYALKSRESLFRKVTTRLRTEKALELGSAITDALRFTIVIPPEEYTRCAQMVLWELQGRQQTILAEENSWGHHDSYSALHYVLRTSNADLYELQLHTPSSYDAKQRHLHQAYEEFRSSGTSRERRQELWEMMSEYWDEIPIPEGALGFGGKDAEVEYQDPR